MVLAHGENPGPLTPAALISEADPLSVMGLALFAVAAAYVWGVWRLSRRGRHPTESLAALTIRRGPRDRWPVLRTVMFLLGLGLIAAATVTGLAAYDTTLLSVHMVQHMLLSMLAPICLALGAPVTLALRTLPARPRAVLLAVIHSGVAKVLTFPLVTFTVFVANPFVLYFSGLYRASLENSWVHEAVHIHLILTGCLFFWPLIGLDPLPGRMSYPLRALLMFLSTPLHTVLGLTVMQSATLLGGDWYPSLDLPWADPFVDQRLAGGILWAGGELVSVAMLGALVVQWMRQAEREGRRIDRALDRQEALEAARSRSVGAG